MSIEQISSSIAELRKKKGVKQEDVARAVGVSAQAVSIANQLKNRLLSSPETCLKPHDFGLDTRPFLSRLAINGKTAAFLTQPCFP